MHGHFFIFYDMLKTLDLPLSEPLIKAFHYRLKAGSFDDYANGYIAGEYKKISNICNNLATVKPREVPDSMESLLTSYNRKPTHTIMDFARFHADFEKINPFQNANGQVNRIILFKESLRAEQIPIIINADKKLGYYHALRTAQTDKNFDELCDLLRNHKSDIFLFCKISYTNMSVRSQSVSMNC